MRVKMITGAVVLLLFIIFIVQNTEVVNIRFLFWGLSLSRVLMIFLVFLSGGVVGWVANTVSRSHRK